VSGEGAAPNVAKYAAHADFCEWHHDQYDFECTCDALTPEQKKRPDWLRRDRVVAPGRERRREDNAVVNDPAPHGIVKPGWYCSREVDHPGPCAAWPVSHATALEFADAFPRRRSLFTRLREFFA